MSNPEKLSHWKSLAALLGTEQGGESEGTADVSGRFASSQAPAPTPPVPPRAPEPPRSAPPKPAPPKSPPVRRESNWGKLASILGLASPPVEEPIARRVETPRQAESPPVPSSGRSSNPQASDAAELASSHWGGSAHASEPTVDPLEMTSEPFIEETRDAIDLESIGDRGGAPESESESSDRPRRRRRRRRGRGRERRPEGEPTSGDRSPTEPVDHTSNSDILDVPLTPVDDEEDADRYDDDRPAEDRGESDRPEESRSDSSEEGGEPRRRRRRRGRGGRNRREEGGNADRPERTVQREKVAPSPASSRDHDDLDDSDDDELMDAIDPDDLDDDEKDDGSQLSHKKIPSWQEAIESVISTNMTSRANNPSSGSRGNRGRGRRDR